MYQYALLFVLCILAVVSPSHAESTVEEEKRRLAALEQSLTRQQSELEEMLEELDSYPAKLSEAEESLLRAEQELANHQRDLADMQRRAQQEDSLQLNRDIGLKEHAIRMAERRVRSETRMLERYRRYHDNLRQDVARSERDIAQLKRRIADQEQRVDFAAAQAAAATASPTPAPAPAAPAISAPPSISAKASDRAAAEPAKPAAKEETLPPLSPADLEAFQLADATMTRVEELIARNPNSGPRYRNLELSGPDIGNIPFTHLGADQYRAEVELPSGTHRFRIDYMRFRVQVSAEDAGEPFVFLVDASSRQRLMKVFYFKKSLLAYRGKTPVVAQDSGQPASKPKTKLTQVKLASGQTVELNEDDAFALEVARDQMSLLAELELDLNQREHNSRYNISGSLLDSATMEHLGKNQYVAELTVQSGRQTVRINRSTFRIEIPEADEGEVYLFFVDASRPRMQMTYYKKALLQYL